MDTTNLPVQDQSAPASVTVKKTGLFPAIIITALVTALLAGGAVWALTRPGSTTNTNTNSNQNPAVTATVQPTTTPTVTPDNFSYYPGTGTYGILPALATNYTKLVQSGGSIKYVKADGTLDMATIQKSASWDELKTLVDYAIYSFSRTKTTGFTSDGAMAGDAESYGRSAIQITPATGNEKQGNYVSTNVTGASYDFVDHKYTTTPDALQTILTEFNDAVDGSLGTPVCPTMDNSCVFQKSPTLTYTAGWNNGDQGILNIDFDLNPINKTASLPFFTTVYADRGMEHYHVKAGILDNGLLVGLKFEYVGNTVNGDNTPWLTVSDFAYSY